MTPRFGAHLNGGATTFRLWAPAAQRVEVVLDRAHPMLEFPNVLPHLRHLAADGAKHPKNEIHRFFRHERYIAYSTLR